MTDKAAARRAAFARRKAAHAARRPDADAHLRTVLAAHRGLPLAGYLPIRTEIDPTGAMAEAAAFGPVAVPVIRAPGAPLDFARWTPETRLVPGPFGAPVPERMDPLVPEVLIVPLVAFTRAGHRLGYGGGFYDRTLARLRDDHPTRAIGFAFAAQEADTLPTEPTDQSLDLVVTDAGIIRPPSSA